MHVWFHRSCGMAYDRLCLRSISSTLPTYRTFGSFARDLRTVFLNSLAYNVDVAENFEIRTMARLLLGIVDAYVCTRPPTTVTRLLHTMVAVLRRLVS